MKGIELPISTLIIIIVCIAVLLAIIMFFFGGYNPTRNAVNLETARSIACQKLTSMSCNVNPETIQVADFDADKNGNMNNLGTGSTGKCDGSDQPGDNLLMLCKCYYGIDDPVQSTREQNCKEKVCNCGKTV